MSQNYNHQFDEQHLLHTLKHYLPSQGPLKDFVHHNTLHAFQDMKFYDAIFKASAIFGYQTTFSLNEYRELYAAKRITPQVLTKAIRARLDNGSYEEWRTKVLSAAYDETIEPRIGRLRREWKRQYPIDLDNAVHPLLFRILCSYLDQGIAISSFPFEDTGLLSAVRGLESHSLVSFFKTKRVRSLLRSKSCSITKLLEILVGKGKETFFEQYVYDQQFAHPGWAGIVSTLEDKPESLLYPKKVSLHDLIVLELLLEIDALTSRFGKTWQPLGSFTAQSPIDIFAEEPHSELQQVLMIWQDAFEWSYYDGVLAGVKRMLPTAVSPRRNTKSFQSIFCIDDRE